MIKTPISGGWTRLCIPAALDGLPPKDVEKIIRRANLGRTNSTIARLRYIDQLPLADIAAAVHLDRSVVGRRLKAQIEPKLNTK